MTAQTICATGATSDRQGTLNRGSMPIEILCNVPVHKTFVGAGTCHNISSHALPVLVQAERYQI
jgi:hypothetical protein